MKKRLLLVGALLLIALIALSGLALAHPTHTAVHASPAHARASLASPCVGLTGPVGQECLLWVVASPNAADFPASGPLYEEVVLEIPARCHILVGIPDFLLTNEFDWSGVPLTAYVTFSSGLHAEMHADNHVRLYNAQSQQLCP